MLGRIILHWSAGTYIPNSVDLEHYHYLIEGCGKIVKGKFTPEDNISCKDNCYAHHTKLGNTGSIGVAMCGMAGFKNEKSTGKYPLLKIQCENCFSLCATLCKKYSIPISEKNIMTHREFNRKNGIKTGKIDIVYLPAYPNIKNQKIEAFIRQKIAWYFSKIN